MRSITTKSSSETKAFGKKIAKELLTFYKHAGKSALVVGLHGDLGGGKTTFVQGFAKGLSIKEKILSPTFVILKKFSIPKFLPTLRISRPKFKTFYHIDCYRIQNQRELLDLGFKEIVSNPENIIIIEWADKAGKMLPKTAMVLKFEFINETTRKIILK